MNLQAVGWTQARAETFSAWELQGLQPARICREDRGIYGLMTRDGSCLGEVSGQFRYHVTERGDHPTVGDWVAVEMGQGPRGIIQAVMPRTAAFVRRRAGPDHAAQVVAANVDIAFLVSGLDGDFNPRRIERYLTLAGASGAAPVILLHKADLVEDVARTIRQTEAVAGGIPIVPTSAVMPGGFQGIGRYLLPGMTGVLLGSSGAGKSTIVNALLGRQVQATTPVRAGDSRGRHTTTCKELFLLPDGAVLIDTPGMRELQLLVEEEALAMAFDDIMCLAEECRFRDCSHAGDPGCSVQEALSAGMLDHRRYESYLRQQREIRYQRIAQRVHDHREERRRGRLRRHPGSYHREANDDLA
jgi:ribosome biogenesis GTPase